MERDNSINVNLIQNSYETYELSVILSKIKTRQEAKYFSQCNSKSNIINFRLVFS